MNLKVDYIDLWDPCGCKITSFGIDIQHKYTCDTKENLITIMIYFLRWAAWIDFSFGGIFASVEGK